MTTSYDWWAWTSRRGLPSKDAETILQLRKDLYEARRTADLWKTAYDELDVMVHKFVDDTLIERRSQINRSL